METFKLQASLDKDGVLRLELPTGLAQGEVDVVVVLHPVEKGAVDALGWPLGFFERTYGAFADNPIERPEQPASENRDF